MPIVETGYPACLSIDLEGGPLLLDTFHQRNYGGFGGAVSTGRDTGTHFMGQRLVYGTLAIFVLLMVVTLDVVVAEWAEALDGALGDLLQRGSILPICILVIMLFAAAELGRLLRAKGARPLMLFAHLMIAALVLTPWLSAAVWLGSGPAQVEGLHWQVVWLAVAVIGTGILLIVRGNPEGTLRDTGATLTLIFYLGFLSSFGVQLRCGRDIPAQDGAWLLLIAVLTTKSSDIAAYFAGSAFGRHKLAPSISPAKTVEGAFGGLLGAALIAALFASASSLASAIGLGGPAGTLVDEITRSFSITRHPSAFSPVWRGVLFGLLLSAVGQIGDLLESCFKRGADTKDSGKIIPRFGGILDLIDSPVMAMPVAWFLLSVVWHAI